MFKGLDHLGIVVTDTEEALKVWRDRFGLKLLFRETVNDGTILLTHLDLGNTHLQLVEPLIEDHPLQDWLKANGSGLHHFCLLVDDLGTAVEDIRAMGLSTDQPQPHQGTRGKRALFLDVTSTDRVPVELTGE